MDSNMTLLNPRNIARQVLGGRAMRTTADMKQMGINQAVNFSLDAIFIAVPKTGTTSIREQMREDRPFIVTTPHLNLKEVRTALDFYFMIRALEENTDFPTADVQTSAQALEESDTFYRKAFKFGSVRNPWARVASLYSRGEGIETSGDISFSEFCAQLRFASDTCTKPTLHQNQIDWLTDSTGEIGVDFILKLEEREKGMKEISDRTDGRVVFENISLNSNPRSQSKKYQNLYDDESRKIVARLFEKDIDLLKYSF